MPATRYKLWKTGGPVQQGVTGAIFVGIMGVAKSAKANLPFVVANELICSRLAQAALLPCPPGFLIDHDGRPHFVSLDFNLAGEDLPPVNPARLTTAHPNLSCGIVLFDIWIANPDRHARNLAHDTTTDSVQIFDHSHAFLRSGDPRGALEASRNNLGFLRRHCLTPQSTALDGMNEWADRIAAIPEFFISEIVASTVDLGLPAELQGYCTEYLLERKDRLLELVRQNRDIFPAVQPNLWDTLR